MGSRRPIPSSFSSVATELEQNLRAVRERITRACESAGRDPADVTLIAVSKTYPADAIRALYDVGQRHFGESRLQEALPKVDALPHDIVWHFIGRLQSNKARRVADTFDAIHTLENEGQLREIAKSRRSVDGLIEVNLANESQKGGRSLGDTTVFAENVVQCPNVRFRGLMAIGPAGLSSEELRPLYRELAQANARLGGTWLSLGMSGDLEAAIAEGATHVRVGTALFGTRQAS
ncbi:YggS family pyridoxal phosphate-dependent enzyme [bacterium]|nr:MAG: YggS family pyridoxal phosphate-dependent enzyme [bacterium]